MQKNLLFLTLFSSIATICCKNQSAPGRNSDSSKASQPKNDSTLIILPDNYSTFKKLFEKAGNPIPRNLAISVLKIDTNLYHDSNYKTVKAIQFSDSVNGFIFNYDCPAGGFCNETELATFKSGQLVTSIDIGHDLSDEGGTDSLSYKIKRDTIFLQERYFQNVETASGKDSIRISEPKTDTMLVDLMSGDIHRK